MAGVRSFAVLALCLLAFAARAEERVTLTPPQMRSVALAGLQAGDPETALHLAEALLARDPGDRRALLVKAQALRDLGQYGAAVTAGKRAWAAADGDADRYAAALVTAQALSSAGRRTTAQFWLRRAVEHAPTPALERRAIRDFRYVRLRNPWSHHLGLTFGPTSNVNNGSARDSVSLYGLPFELTLSGAAKALSGWETGVDVSSRYRITSGERLAHDLLFRLSHDSYVLSDEARKIAPDAKGSDFAYSVLGFGLTQRRMLNGEKDELVLTALWTGSLYGGDPYGADVQLDAQWRNVLSQKTMLTFGSTAEAKRGPKAPHADVAAFRGTLRHVTAGGTVLSLSAAASRSHSDTVVARYDELRLGASVTPQVDWPAGMVPTLGVSLRGRDYPQSLFTFDGRQDRELSIRLDMAFRDLDRYGFMPVLTVESARTESNISLYDTRRTGVGLSIRSAF